MRLTKAIHVYGSLALARNPTRYIFSFGDSYTETGFAPTGAKPAVGNPFGNPPYPGTTTSGGPNWIGNLVHDLSPSNTLSWNFAYGGATVNKTLASVGPTALDFIAQRDEFMQNVNSETAQWNAGNSVFITYFGTNDVDVLHGQLGAANGTCTALVDSYFNIIKSLYDVGARRFVVFQMDPLDRTPIYKTFKQQYTSGVQADIVRLNSEISSMRDAFVSRNPGAQMQLLDTMSIFDDVLNRPAAHGSPDDICNNKDGTSCLWWNILHPGQAIQKALAQEAFKVLTSMGFYD